MKKFLFCLLMTATIFVLSCTKKDNQDTSVPDPAGTITTNLGPTSWLILWQKTFGSNEYTSYLGTTIASVTGWITNIETYNTGQGPTTLTLQGETTDMGEVHGLGNVTVKPTTGFTFNVALTKGHGYVVRYKIASDYATSTVPYTYGRYYIVDFLTDAFGEIVGVTIKYQDPF